MSPSEFNVDPEAQTNIEERQVDDTAEDQRGNNTTTQSSDKHYGDPSDPLWSMYLTKSRKEDVQMAKAWTEDAGGFLVFNGLFSAVVAAFLMESYKKLSPDSGDQTVALLTQLVNISAGAPAVLQSSPPFEAPASIIRVNVVWFLSLILSLTCGILATLVQQWARRYLVYAQPLGEPRKRARIQAYMFEGVVNFRVSQAILFMPFLLHLSVFLFFAGLVDFLLPINESVAHSAFSFGLGFVFEYAILTLLPIFVLNSPVFTPLSGLAYVLLQFLAFSLFSAAKAIESIIHGLLLKIRWWTHPDVRGSPNDVLTKWRAMLEDKVLTYSKRFFRGLHWRIEFAAMEAPSRVDARALYRTLATLDEAKELEDFIARMPGFFNSHAAPNATSAMLSLMSEDSEDSEEPVLGSRLRELLGSCLPGTSLLSERQRTYRLHVCLTSLWYCVRAYNQPENSGVALAPYVRATFASPQVIHWIQTEQDVATRLLGRCFGSLIVKKLANDITSPTRTSIASTTAEMACLSNILGATGDQVTNWLGQEGAIDLANIISLISGEIDTLVVDGTNGMTFDVLDVFQQTLSILVEGTISGHSNVMRNTDDIPSDQVSRFHEMYSGFANERVPEGTTSAHANVKWNADHLPPDQVTRFHEIYSKFANSRVPDLLKERLRHLSDRLSSSSESSYVEEVKMEVSGPEQDSETTTSPGTSWQ